MRLMRTAILLSMVALTFGCSGGPESAPPADSAAPASPISPTDERAVLESREGRAAYVAASLDGKKTASGAVFDGTSMVAAHPTYPFDTLLRVTNLENERKQEVRVVDRGPATASQREGVIIDLSRAAADALGFVEAGQARVRVEVLRWGTGDNQPGAVTR